jgi:hypothetical protein
MNKVLLPSQGGNVISAITTMFITDTGVRWHQLKELTISSARVFKEIQVPFTTVGTPTIHRDLDCSSPSWCRAVPSDFPIPVHESCLAQQSKVCHEVHQPGVRPPVDVF